MANASLTWLGHASFRIDSPGGKRIYVDPWISGPTCPAAEKEPEHIDVIAVTHGHGDHTGDVVQLGKKHRARLVAVHELAVWLDKQGYPDGSSGGMGKGGTVEVDGTDVARLPEATRDRFRAAKIGYVFQTFNLLPAFSALENVLLGMTFGGGRPDAARAQKLLERVGLGHRLQHRPPMMSVGEQQRVAVARALANRPKLLLADEPTANVDARHQQQVVDLLRETCREEQVALVMVTHADDVAAQFDRVEKLEELNLAVRA